MGRMKRVAAVLAVCLGAASSQGQVIEKKGLTIDGVGSAVSD